MFETSIWEILAESTRKSDTITKHSIILVTLIAFTNLLLGGCTKIVNRQFDEVGDRPQNNIRAAITKQGDEVKFDRSGGIIDANLQAVTGVSDKGQRVTIALDDVDHFRIKKAAVVKSLLLTTLIIGTFVGVEFLISMEGLGDDPIL